MQRECAGLAWSVHNFYRGGSYNDLPPQIDLEEIPARRNNASLPDAGAQAQDMRPPA